MPPPLEEEEDLEQDEAFNSDSDELIDLDFPIDETLPEATSYPPQLFEAQTQNEAYHERWEGSQSQEEPQEKPQEVSPVPLVVSDIINGAGPMSMTTLPALKHTAIKEKTRKKRTRDHTELSQGSFSKKKKGNKREIPCIYCVRRLANDPKWSCHDAVGQNGVGYYKGSRCGECVRAHVSCHVIPDKATEPVQTLVKAAADAVATSGTNKIQLLAAYEAAIRPALRAVIVTPEPHTPGPQKRKRNELPEPKSKPSIFRHQTTQGSSTSATTPAQTFASLGAGAGARQQQYAQADPADISTPILPPHQDQRYQHQHQDGADLERLERQALRRRKVEALESLSHTAALLLAEFMTFNKRQSSFCSSSAGGAACDELGGGAAGGSYSAERSLPAQNHGMDYAAAAAAGMVANIFRPPVANENHDYQPYSNSLDVANDSDSEDDSSVASTIANNDGPIDLEPRISAVNHGDGIEMESSDDSDSDDDDGGSGKQEEAGNEDGTRERMEVKMEEGG